MRSLLVAPLVASTTLDDVSLLHKTKFVQQQQLVVSEGAEIEDSDESVMTANHPCIDATMDGWWDETERKKVRFVRDGEAGQDGYCAATRFRKRKGKRVQIFRCAAVRCNDGQLSCPRDFKVVGDVSGMCATSSRVCEGHALGTPFEDTDVVPSEEDYEDSLAFLNIEDVVADIAAVLTDSKECWPADYGNYGPFFIRLAWHCSGSYRATDGKGGCAGGRLRFEPERSWDDNTNLDKARALLAHIKVKYGDALSWGDLFALSGTVAIEQMGGPVQDICVGRIDDSNGDESLILNDPCDGQDGNCQRPWGTTTVGLIYLNPEGPLQQNEAGEWAVNPDPAESIHDVVDAFGRMGFTARQTVALIGGGHAFGKTHGPCPDGPGEKPSENVAEPWLGNCGTGKGDDTFTSGFEGPWTTNPIAWDNEFFEYTRSKKWVPYPSPAGHTQWYIDGATGAEAKLMRLTADLALMHNEEFAEIVNEFADNQQSLNTAFEDAWFRLTTQGGRWADNAKCRSGVPPSLIQEYMQE